MSQEKTNLQVLGINDQNDIIAMFSDASNLIGEIPSIENKSMKSLRIMELQTIGKKISLVAKAFNDDLKDFIKENK